MKAYLEQFKKRRIAVIGDLMLDKYIFGSVDRISPEAPVPILRVEKESYVPGGAANAANNIVSMTGQSMIAGIVGQDLAKNTLLELAKEKGIDTSGIVEDKEKPTIQKIRVLGQNQQLIRIDYEDNNYLGNKEGDHLLEKIKNCDELDAIIVSDYAKGTISDYLMEKLKKFCKEKNVFLIIDPKPKHKSFYKSAFLITPNKKEAEKMAGMEINTKENLEKAGKKLVEELDCNVLITTGEKGMSLFSKDDQIIHIPTVAKEVYDVSGAGDTVVAVLSLALSSGASLKEAAFLANHAAGIKVGKLGTAPVALKELKQALR